MLARMNEQRHRFADAYAANGGNGAKAAREAGYSNGSAKQRANFLLKLPCVKAAIEKAEARFKKEMATLGTEGWDSARVMAEAIRLYTRGVREGKPLPQLENILTLIGKHQEIAAFERKSDPVSSDGKTLLDRIQEGRKRVTGPTGGHEQDRAVAEAMAAGDRAQVAELFDNRRDTVLARMEGNHDN